MLLQHLWQIILLVRQRVPYNKKLSHGLFLAHGSFLKVILKANMQKGKNCFGLPQLGFGLGLRTPHYRYILEQKPQVDWFEVISENFMDSKGWPLHVLDQIAERYPVVMHGVSMSIGSSDPLNVTYLKSLKKLARRTGAKWVSDHLCWTGILGHNTHDLLPLPFTEESLQHVVQRIKQVQEVLERPLILENPSSYLTYHQDSFTEWDFIREMANESNCGLLLDVNNIYVSSVNHGFDAVEYLNAIPMERVVQMHIAGHTDCGTHIIDTHDHPVVKEVWRLYEQAQKMATGASTLLEWDAKIPDFPELQKELGKAKNLLTKAELENLTPPETTNNISVPHPLSINTPSNDQLAIL